MVSYGRTDSSDVDAIQVSIQENLRRQPAEVTDQMWIPVLINSFLANSIAAYANTANSSYLLPYLHIAEYIVALICLILNVSLHLNSKA